MLSFGFASSTKQRKDGRKMRKLNIPDFPKKCAMRVALVIITLVMLPLVGRSQSSMGKNASTTNTDKNWKVPRTPDGHPDLQGVWSNNSMTPFLRPKQWAGKAFLTDAELEQLKLAVAAAVDDGGDAIFGDGVILAAIEKEKAKSYDPSTGNYNHFWLSGRDWDNRTSRIIDPENGLLPPMTPEGLERVKAHPPTGITRKADGPEDRPLSERCITYGGPYTGAGYDSYFQIVQSPESVAIIQEVIHDTRLIPLNGGPHLPQNVRQWLGDPRGHWEGDTLVVETTNYSAGAPYMGATENVRVTERYTRVSPDYINWEITVDDPATWTKSWTEMIRLKRATEEIYEYACHEGNIAMVGILGGARAEEKAAAEAAPKDLSTSK
jgi:hypothetical protein